MLVFAFLLYGGLNHITFLSRCFLLLAVSIFAFLLYKLSLKYNKNHIGLYRDDGLAIFKNISGPNSEKVKKDIQKLTKKNELDIVTQCNMETDI